MGFPPTNKQVWFYISKGFLCIDNQEMHLCSSESESNDGLENTASKLCPASHPSLPRDPSACPWTLKILSNKSSTGKGGLSCYSWPGPSHLQITYWCQPASSGPAPNYFAIKLWIEWDTDKMPSLVSCCELLTRTPSWSYSPIPVVQTMCVWEGDIVSIVSTSIVLQCFEFFCFFFFSLKYSWFTMLH